MKKWIFTGVLAALFSMSTLSALQPSDQKAIETMIGDFTKAWNLQQGSGSSEHYAEEADFINIFGSIFSGKEEIEKRHQEIHKGFMKDSRFQVEEIKFREIKEDVVMAQVYWIVDGGQLKEPMRGIFSHLFCKKQEGWQILSTQNTMVRAL